MSDESSTYTKGDRVKVTIEGEVLGVHYGSGTPAHSLRLTAPGCDDYNHRVRLGADNFTIEKLAPKEPQWKHGTLIRFTWRGSPDPLVYDEGANEWRWPTGGATTFSVTKEWNGGRVEILWEPS